MVRRHFFVIGPEVGQIIIDRISDPIMNKDHDQKLKDLTPREIEIVDLIKGGANNQEIANQLYISVRTVKNHITNILSKLDLHNRTEVAILANSHHSIK